MGSEQQFINYCLEHGNVGEAIIDIAAVPKCPHGCMRVYLMCLDNYLIVEANKKIMERIRNTHGPFGERSEF